MLIGNTVYCMKDQLRGVKHSWARQMCRVDRLYPSLPPHFYLPRKELSKALWRLSLADLLSTLSHSAG
jgi:hypothetical protein